MTQKRLRLYYNVNQRISKPFFYYVALNLGNFNPFVMSVLEDYMKSIIRKSLLAKRREMLPSEVETKSAQILANLMASDLLDNAEVVMCYMDFRNEVQTESMIEYLWSLNKTVVLPKVNPHTNQLDLFEISGFRDMIQSKMGISEPADHLPSVHPTDVDLILAPGVAYDMKGFRMGYGGGFYDRLLPQVRPDCVIIGLAFELQVVDELPIEDYDEPVNGILTETRYIPASAR